MNQSFFVTGTDTDVGKTYVSRLLLKAFNHIGQTTAGFKPVSAGCEATLEGLRNEDALILQQAASIDLPYDLVNPIALEPPVAPHLAAKEIGRAISLDELTSAYQQIQHYQPDITLVEGAGGWRLPLGQGKYLSDFAIQHKVPVILVVGMRLGCLNHALLTAEAIQNDGLHLAGWVANHIDPNMSLQQENLQSLAQLINAPLLASVPFNGTSEAADISIDVSLLPN